MLSPELLNDREFSFVDPDFVNVEVQKLDAKDNQGEVTSTYSVSYTFEIYINLFLALIKQFDEIEFRITEHSTTKLDYFTSDTSPEGVAESVSTFIGRVKKSLVENRRKNELALSRVKTASFLSDSIVSGIGSGRINEENYELYLPQVDVAKNSYLDSGASARSINIGIISVLAKRSFTEFSLHPSEIFERSKSEKNIRSFTLPLQIKKTLDQGAPNPVITSSSAKQKFKPCKIVIPILGLSESEFQDLAAKKQYYLDLVFFRKGVPKLKTSYSFQNREEFQNLCMRTKDLRLTIVNGQFRPGRDSVRILNPNSFAMLYMLEQHAVVNRAYTVNRVSSGIILPNSSITATANIDFGTNSESRCYMVTGIRDLPIRNGGSKIMDCASIPAARKISYQSIKLEAFAEQSGDAINVYTKNVPEFVDLVIVEKKEKGKETFGVVNSLAPNTSLSDLEVVEYTDYVYRIRFYSDGCEVLEQILIPISIKEKKKEILEVDFGVELASSTINGRQITHTLRINETRTVTVAGSLQEEIVSSGLSDKFDEERENNKSQISATTRYKITRSNLETGQSETIPTLYSPGEIKLSFEGDPTHQYRYTVKLFAVNTASVSYLTVVQREDVQSGNGYKFRFRKWRSQALKRLEALPSQQQIVRNSLEEGIDVGGVGEQKIVDVVPAIRRPQIVDLVVTQDLFNRVNYISWNTVGDVTEVDHFIILQRYSGAENVVGTASRNKFVPDGKYIFAHQLPINLLGEVDYRVILVERGMLLNEPVGPATIKLEQNVPERSLLRSRA